MKRSSGTKAVTGVVGNRKQVSLLRGCPQEDFGKLLCQCAKNPIDPVTQCCEAQQGLGVRGPAKGECALK